MATASSVPYEAASRTAFCTSAGLTVAPDHQGHRVGTALIAAVEGSVDPGVRRATLFTGHLSAANLRLCERYDRTSTWST
jgi:GNAT superfamily N-acetyltransferase